MKNILVITGEEGTILKREVSSLPNVREDDLIIICGDEEIGDPQYVIRHANYAVDPKTGDVYLYLIVE